MLSMLFYSALVTTILSLYPALQFWSTPTIHELILLAILGTGSNLILYCLLKGFSMVNASAVAPYRYLELVLSAIFGFIIFQEIPSSYTYVGAAIIVPTTLFIAYKQLQKS
jgi:S-adenosylmethionine uptake transporter